MIDLSTNYLGLKLRNPIVVSASPLTEKLENFARLEDAGASAIVMYSLMEEQIEADSENIDNALEYGANSYAESTSYLPDMPKYTSGLTAIWSCCIRARSRSAFRSSPA